MTFEQLYLDHYQQIFKFCYRFVADREKAGDLTQDTFLKLYQRMEKGDHAIENPRAWLYKVAGNACLNDVGKVQRRAEISSGLHAEGTESKNPESILLAREEVILLKKFINQQKPEHQLLLLMYQDGLSYKEMAEATGIPLNSIGKTLWRNIEKISNAIKLTEYEPGRTVS